MRAVRRVRDASAKDTEPGKRATPLAKAGKRAADPEDDQRNVVNSLAKGLRVLEAFTAERPELTLTEVARARPGSIPAPPSACSTRW